ncbi:MAG: hypothetical protein HN978_12390 [Desulfobacula sp.]|jgi:hypothetical protein|nr:hypothetical protein [Desulfobacula sp.]
MARVCTQPVAQPANKNLMVDLGVNACKQYFALLSAAMIVIIGKAASSGQFALDEHFGTCCYRVWRT